MELCADALAAVCGDDRGQHSPPALSLYPQGADPELRARRLSAAACQRRCPLVFPPPALLHRHAGNSHVSRSRSRLCRARAAQYREENRRPLPHRRVRHRRHGRERISSAGGARTDRDDRALLRHPQLLCLRSASPDGLRPGAGAGVQLGPQLRNAVGL